MMHETPSSLAGKTVKIKPTIDDPHSIAGKDFVVEDWYDRVNGKSWMNSVGNVACLIYAMRAGFTNLPTNDNVLYGKIGHSGFLVHVNEIEGVTA